MTCSGAWLHTAGVEEYTDAELLAAAGEGNGDAFGILFRRHVRPITGYAVRRCDNADDVADLVSDTFMIALDAAHRYIPQTDTALPWLFGIARRVHTRQRRRTRSFLRLVSKNTNAQISYADEETTAIESAIDAARAANEMQDAMQRLSAGEREVLELVAIDGMTPTEAALVLDLTPNAARLKLSRARKHMQRMLRDELHPGFEQEVGGAY
jgi:RNA polymerase sigma-70 factor (ECF subfamily)